MYEGKAPQLLTHRELVCLPSSNTLIKTFHNMLNLGLTPEGLLKELEQNFRHPLLDQKTRSNTSCLLPVINQLSIGLNNVLLKINYG